MVKTEADGTLCLSFCGSEYNRGAQCGKTARWDLSGDGRVTGRSTVLNKGSGAVICQAENSNKSPFDFFSFF